MLTVPISYGKDLVMFICHLQTKWFIIVTLELLYSVHCRRGFCEHGLYILALALYLSFKEVRMLKALSSSVHKHNYLQNIDMLG